MYEIFNESLTNDVVNFEQLDPDYLSIAAQMTHTATSNTPVCYACGLNIFRELAFQYRKTLKKEDFPGKTITIFLLLHLSHLVGNSTM